MIVICCQTRRQTDRPISCRTYYSNVIEYRIGYSLINGNDEYRYDKRSLPQQLSSKIVFRISSRFSHYFLPSTIIHNKCNVLGIMTRFEQIFKNKILLLAERHSETD